MSALRYLFLLPFVVAAILILLILLVISIIFRLRTILIYWAKISIWVFARILGLRFEIKGKEKIQKQSSYVFMANHLSLLDGPLLFFIIPKPVRVILKESILKIPVVGLSMRQAEFISVDRKGISTGKKSIDKAALLMKKKGYSFLVFPEGTRSRDGRMKTFRRGGFFLAVNSGVPVLPMTVEGTFGLLPKGSFWIKRGRINITFHDPVSTHGLEEDDIPRLMEKTRNIIRSGLMDLVD